MSAAEGSAPSAPVEADEPAAPSRPRCLVVDDEQAIRSALGGERFDVTALDAPSSALELIRDQSIDVVLLDLGRSGVSGAELLKAIKQLAPDVEVIMMTAPASVETAVEAVRAGAFDYLTKPFEHTERVVQVVERAVERRTLIRKTRNLQRKLAGEQRASTHSGSAGMQMRPLLNLPFRAAKDTAIRSFERLYVEGLLAETAGNISDAARRAGLDRSNFRRILSKHKVDASAFRK